MGIVNTIAALAGEREPSSVLCFAQEAYTLSYADYLKAHQPCAGALPAYSPTFTVIAEKDVAEDALNAQTYPYFELVRNGEDISGEYVLHLHEGDVLAPEALYTFALALDSAKGADLLYADEDMYTNAQRHSPSFKPDFSITTLLSYNYIGRPFMVSRKLYEASGGMAGVGPEVEYDYTLRCAAQCVQPLHIAQVLLSRTKKPQDPNPDRILKSLDTLIQRREREAFAVVGLWKGSFRMRRNMKNEPAVGIVIPNKDNADKLRRLLESIDDTAMYKNYRIIIADAHSHDARTQRYYALLQKNNAAKVITSKAQSYASLCNAGAKRAHTPLLLFITPDVLPVTNDWIYALCELASRKGVGAIGPKVTDGEKHILEAGRVVGLEGGVKSIYQGEDDEPGELLKNRFINTLRSVSALSGSCLMISREAFFACGGFDESLEEDGADTDLCLRLSRMGRECVYTPFVEFVRPDGAEAAEPSPSEQAQLRVYDVTRMMLAHGDPNYNLNYDYASVVPLVATQPYPAIQLNSFWHKADPNFPPS